MKKPSARAFGKEGDPESIIFGMIAEVLANTYWTLSLFDDREMMIVFCCVVLPGRYRQRLS